MNKKEYNLFCFLGQSLQHGVDAVNPTNVQNDANDNEIIEFRTDQRNYGKPTLDRLRNNTLSSGETLSSRFSPANAFARRMYQVHGLRNIVIAVMAFGGHGITRFLDPSRRLVTPADSGADRYDECIDFIDGVERNLKHGGSDVNFRGFVWWQGSSDGANQSLKDNYQTHLERVVADYRTNTNIGSSDSNWLIARSSQGGTNSNWPSTGDERHRAQETVGTNDLNAAWTSVDNPLGTTNVFSDGTHPDASSTERIGTVMADAWVSSFGV